MNDLSHIVPACLRDRPQWVVWKYIQRNGKSTKAPINPATGNLASSTDPADWGTFSQSLDALAQDANLAGVGFVFSADDPYCGVDLDNCIDPTTGELKDWAADFVSRFDSYTEISPSGFGVKIFLKANKPGRRCRKSYHDGEVEIYDRDRFFTVTGQRLEQASSEVQLRQNELEVAYQTVFGIDDEDTGPACASRLPVPIPSDSGQAQLHDDEILDIASNQRRSGDKFRSLWNGDWNAHFNSASEADSSVIFTLAFYSKDHVQLDRLFRRSGLMRSKWDELHGEQTYGETTIAKALGTVSKQYQPKEKRRSSSYKKSKRPSQSASKEPMPGSIDPKTGRLILSTTRTLPTAEAFVHHFFEHAEGRTIHHYAGINLAWSNGRFSEIEDNGLRHQILPWMHEAVQMIYSPEAEDYLPRDFPANPRTVNSALESIKSLTHLPSTVTFPSWLHSSESRPDALEIVPCRSSLLHLPTMTRLPATPQFFSLNSLDIDPELEATTPANWLRFLHELFDGDTESWDLLQDWFGYCLTGDTSQQKMLLIVGPKRSGKGTIARVLTNLIGAANISGPTTSSLAGPFGLQPLLGKSLAIVSDARFSGEGVQTVIERLLCISGEDALTIDRKHLPSITMKVPIRFMLLTNELPRLHDASGALAGRFMILRLTESFYGKEDRSLTEKLLQEIPGIFNWSVEGWKRLRSRGAFVQPSCVQETIDGMLELASPVTLFVRDCCDLGSDAKTSVTDLYEAWCDWCRGEGISRTPNRQTFGRDLAAAFPSIVCRRNQVRGRFYHGIKLRTDASVDDQKWSLVPR